MSYIRVVLLLLCTAMGFAESASFIWLPNSEPDVAGYRIYYGNDNTFNEMVDVGNVTRATIQNLIPGNTYRFYATCYNTSGLESDPSDIVTVDIPPMQPPTRPRSLRALKND
jgi:hypothetical protein